MSYRGWYFVAKLASMLVLILAFYFLSRVSPWAVYGVALVMFFSLLDDIAEWCRRRHKDELQMEKLREALSKVPGFGNVNDLH